MSAGARVRYPEGMTSYQRIEKVIRYVETRGGESPRVGELARVAGLGERHFQRLFARWAGTNPKDYLKFVAGARAKELLRGSSDVLGAALEAGLSGPGRLHDLLVTVEGVTPGEYKSGGAGVTIRHGFAETPFGLAHVGVTERGICRFAFVSDRAGAARELRRAWPEARLISDPAAAAKAARSAFGAGKRRVPVVLRGTPFQLKVWEALLRIPSGRAASYGQVAAAVGAPSATRAVGTAIGANPVAFLIPCHRVLRGSGALGGYRWGTGRKRAILAWESCRA